MEPIERGERRRWHVISLLITLKNLEYLGSMRGAESFRTYHSLL